MVAHNGLMLQLIRRGAQKASKSDWFDSFIAETTTHSTPPACCSRCCSRVQS